MGQAGCQFQTLLWKNWLCRLRHPVLSLAEFFWPCILFMILIVLRFQEPPRHRDTCYLQPRDLPNQGVLSFVQGLLCNTGSSCRNFSFEDSMDHQSRLSRFQTTAHDMKINSLAFLREIQDLAEDIYETMGKAKTLQKFWEQRSETLDSSQGTSFLTMDLNKTEEVISKLEILYQKPHIWNFLLSLPKLHVTHVHVEDGIGAAIHFLQAVSNSLTSLGDLDWLRLHQTFSQVSKIVLNVTISTLTFLKQNGAVVNESVYHLSLKNIVWNPEKVQSDLKSQFGFDDLQMEHILNYSAELREIPTDGFLERMVCSALFSTSEDEAETKGYGGDCQLKWSETKNYLIHAVSWLQVYREVFDQWLQGGLLQKMFTGVRHSLEDLMDLFEEESEPQKVMRALHAALLLLSDSLAADGPEDKHPSPYIFQHLQKFQTVLHNLPWWPGIQRLQQLDDAVRNAMTQDFHFVKEILTSLETSANDSVQGGPDRWQLKKDEFFGELKQLLTKNATATCLNGHPSKEALLISGNFSILGDLWELWCHHSENKTSVLNKLLAAVEDADHILQEVINGHTNTSALLSEGHLGWTELEMQLSEVSLSCSRLFQLPKADASSVDGVCSGGCEHQLVSTVIFHILEQAQTYLEQIPYWKTFLRFIRITCEAIRYVNMQGSFQNNPMVFSEDSPCYKENMDWKLVSDNYFIFFNNLMKSPITSVSSVVDMCQAFQQLETSSEAMEMLQKAKMMVLHVLIIFAENPSLTKDILCATLSCKPRETKHLVLAAIQGVTAVYTHYQEIKKIWPASSQLNCESLIRNLSRTLEPFTSNLDHVTNQDCACQPPLETVEQHVHWLAKRFKESWLSGNPIMSFLSNFTVTEDVKIKDLMRNITRLTEELQSSIHISNETIHTILEANISHSQILTSALTVALSGKCDQEILHLLLTFPEDEKSWLAVKELCGLPGSEVYTLIVAMSQNLNLRTFVYKALIPPEANGLLKSLLDVISSLSSLLARAQHVFQYLPEFLHASKITALIDMPDLPQIAQNGPARSSAFGSFQTMMKLVCKDQTSFLSNSNMFINLPRVNELLEDDKEKFNIPEYSTPFCLKLYQEILQSPNGALVWSFLKPILHGKILYTPDIPEINKIIQKANYTFYFVDKLKSLSEILLKMSHFFQGSGHGQMFNQLQDALRNKFIRHFIESQLHIDVDKLTETLQTYDGMVDKMFNHTGTGHFQFLGSILVNLSSCVVLDRFQAVKSVDVLETKAHELMQQNNFLASVIFNSSLVHRHVRSASLKLPPHVTYTIRTSILYSMRTDLIKNPSWKFHPQSLPADGFKYNYIFVPLQDMIERAIIMVQTGQDALEPTTQTQAAPYPCHTSDLFLNNVGFFFPLIMMLTWMVSVASMVQKLVYEREIQIEEYMRMMGVHPTIHFLAWFLENMAVLTLSSIALAIILKTSGIFMHSDAFIIILFFLDFGVSVIMLSYFLSAFFSQANTAALCTSLVYMLSFLPYIILLVLHNQLSVAIQTLLCLLPTTAFGQGVFFITFLEGQETGIQWNNIYQAPEAGGMTFGWVCWMILIDSIIYFLCGWYLSNLIPGTFGLRKHWYFPFTASYWKNVCVLVEKRQHSLSSNLFFFNENFGNKGSTHQNKAGELKGGLPGVTLVSVNKEYEGHRLAVQDLTLTFHRGQITALLGTNGAGKTTVISMLTGLYPPTSGTIMVDGKNLQTDLPRIRMELGVCPQRDVLLDNLTVREHLLLFASIKAPWWTTKERQQQVNKTLDKVGLTNHQHKPTRALSGGMKRKLSIGIAFIGTSRTVILDEPTSGVDPCSRRSIWDILLKYREGRTIIFTTHHLDEAELLSDCVAILQQGRLRCCGPPLCLKEAYSQGLSLTLTKQCSVLEAHDAKDVARITSLIQVYVPQAFLKDSSGGELTYTIPEAADKTCFKGLFQALDQNLQHLHLTGYGISDTTLEQVFLKLLQDSNKKSHIALGTMLEPQNQRPTGPLFDYCDSPSWNPPEKNLPVCMRGHQLLLVQVTALLRRRLYHTLRAWKSTFSNLLLPVLFVALAMGLFMVQPLATTYPPLKLTPGHYERAESYFFSSGKDNMDLTHVLLRKFKDHDHHCGNLDAALKNSSRWHKDPFSSSAFQDSCGCLLQKCPNGSAPYLTNCLGHKLLNLSGFNVEEYLLQPSEKPRLGGWSFGAGVLNKVQDSRTMAKVWFNQKGFHSLPSYLNHLNNLILWRHLPSTVDWRQYGITLYSHPYGGALLNEDKILESIRQCGVALCIVLGFSVLSAWFGSSVVRDRVTGAKKLQHLSGLGYRTYWFTYFFHDMLFYLVSVSLCVAIIAAFQLTAFTFRENLAATALLLALFGYAMLPWMYLMSRIFSSPDVAFISYISLNFIFGLCTMLMTTMPKLLAIISKAQNLQNIYNVLKWVFTIFPQFCLGQGLLELCYNQIKYDLTHNFGIDSYASPFEMNFLGWIYVVLALQGTFLLLLRILLHWDLLWQPRGHTVLEHTVKFSKDRDVEKEQMRVFEGRTSGDILVLCNLSKSYRSFCKKVTAVEDVTVGIPKGECFGLLGVNGAGKSTMFKMLNGEIPPSSGHAVIRTPLGDDIDLSSAGEAGILIGYCPQQDALDDLLTGWEHLHYYCSLRGIPKQCIKEVAGDLVRRLHLEAHADKLVVTYSGGTKRKLSTALAMVGKPDILLLDEPSSGMDACSKRYLWQTIMKEVREGCAAVLTSHSMEECEALCTRLAIMVDGSFKCLGSPQHIKNRFGDGYVVKIWLSKEADQPSTISDCLKLHFPEIQFKGQCLNLLEYHVPKTWECLADLFKVLENNRTLLNIKHYSINQTTLEQVFIHFAGEQQPTVQSTPDLSSDSQHLSHLPV
ncbi:ATP-binding cassette sub-family A member 13 isoform X3 [Perognathus longimembris pacificus]|uniref:ATP-binding cassette sub-family A member 13 isoform X3 n=1 Tax=Perognathus longimembris pacificus TaxID=214514 RepID=UPI0020196A67|nr:ATP-binding cassette sub-family A member 13 isoform X3 [Perognathus longimembris pacificus]